MALTDTTSNTDSTHKYQEFVADDLRHVLECIIKSEAIIQKVILEKKYDTKPISQSLNVLYVMRGTIEYPESTQNVYINSEPRLEFKYGCENYLLGPWLTSDRKKLYDKILSDVEEFCQAPIVDISNGCVDYLDESCFESLKLYDTNLLYVLPYSPLLSLPIKPAMHITFDEMKIPLNLFQKISKLFKNI